LSNVKSGLGQGVQRSGLRNPQTAHIKPFHPIKTDESTKKLAHTVVYVYIKGIIYEKWEDMKMQTTQAEKLVRKQFLISPSQVKKLNRLARDEGTSVAAMVRVAIDSYNPDTAAVADLDAPELIELVSERLKEAITSTRKANRAIDKTLKKLSEGIL